MSGPDTLEATLLGPAGFGNFPEGRKLSVSGRAAAAWSLARKRFDEDHTPERKDTNSDASLTNEKRLLILSNFQQRYGHAMPPEDLPSDRTLALARNAWEKRPAEPIPFSMILSEKDGDAQSAGYLLVVPGSALAIHHTFPKKNHQWTHSMPHYIQSVELLLVAYAMVSCLDEAGSEWMHCDVERAYLAKLNKKMERLDALSGPNQWAAIAECETAIRNDWHDRNVTDPALSLSDLLTLSIEHDRYPGASKFTPSRMPRWRAPMGSYSSAQWSQASTSRVSYPKYASHSVEPFAKKQKTQGPQGKPIHGARLSPS